MFQFVQQRPSRWFVCAECRCSHGIIWDVTNLTGPHELCYSSHSYSFEKGGALIAARLVPIKEEHE